MNILKLILRLFLKLFFKTKLTYHQQILLNEPSIIIPNHTSFLDAVFVFAYLPNDVCFVINTRIAKKLELPLKLINHVTIDPLSPYSLKKLINLVKSGQSVVIFPEGRISRTGMLMKVYNGIGLIALKTNATLVPIIFTGLKYSKLSRVTDKFKAHFFPQVSMYIGDSFKLDPSKAKSFRLQKKEISNQILQVLQKLSLTARQLNEPADNIFNQLYTSAKLFGANKRIIIDINGEVSYKKLLIGTLLFANKLKPLLHNNANVGILLPNSIANVLTLLSLSFLGKTPAILNFSTGIDTVLNSAQVAQLKTIVTSRAFIEKGNFQNLEQQLQAQFNIIYLENIKQQINFNDKIISFLKYLLKVKTKFTGTVILFTSGSEGLPKGVVLSHKNILSNINQISTIIDYNNNDKFFNALPMFHSLGLTAGTLLPLLDGMEVFLYPSPLHYKLIPEIIYRHNSTIMITTPTFAMGYGKNAHPYDFYSIRFFVTGGEKLKDEVRTFWLQKFGVRIFEGYGTTETAPVLAVNTPLFNKPGTVGKIMPGIDVKLEPIAGIAAGGSLKVKGPNIMEGYLLHNKGFVPHTNWYDTGDIVDIDEEGFISIKSRLKRFAKISGEMISLDLVEKLAEECFNNSSFAAINLPDKRKGEKIIIYTTYKQFDKQTFRTFILAKGFTLLFMPAEIIILEPLPLLGNGKIDYVTLKGAVTK